MIQILALRGIIVEVKKNNVTAVVCFFNSIHRMVWILMAYGVSPILLQDIRTMYTGTRTKAVPPDGNSKLAELLQRDTLASILLTIVLDYALKQAIIGREQELTITPRRSR